MFFGLAAGDLLYQARGGDRHQAPADPGGAGADFGAGGVDRRHHRLHLARHPVDQRPRRIIFFWLRSLLA